MALTSTQPAAIPKPDPMWLADTPPPPAALRPSVPRPPVLLAPPKLLAKIGEAFATGIAGAADRLRGGDAEAVGAVLAELEDLALEVQQMARVMGHEGTLVAESVDLNEALARALQMWSGRPVAGDFAFAQPESDAARVLVDPALLEQLLDLAIELAFEWGDSLAVRVRAQPVSRQAVLLIDVQRRGGIAPAAGEGAAHDEGADHVRWLMLTQVARAGGIAARREASGSMLSLVITLPMATYGPWADQVMGSSV